MVRARFALGGAEAAKAVRTLLRRLLEAEYGKLSTTVVERLNGADPDALDAWTARLADVSSPEELVGLDDRAD